MASLLTAAVAAAPARGAAVTARAVAVRAVGAPARDVRAFGFDAGKEKAFFGEDFGARDPFEAELATNFNETSLGEADTSHIIKPPEKMASLIGLSSKACYDLSVLEKLGSGDVTLLRNQAAGWRLASAENGDEAIEQSWRLKSADAAEELKTRLEACAEKAGHPILSMEVVAGDSLAVTLGTPSKGGLTVNDFILAAKLNDVPFGDLAPPKKQRFWA
ncbi:unnamed protein product [Pedinophyceae sp. YPF-701]|nr:unnamed protein product [Pedinophyceae sp. YPF-701]